MSKMTVVSSKDLKAHGAELVERAARGERIVVTRYGTPRAMLGPIDGGGEPRGSKAKRAHGLAEFERERRAFDRLSAEGRLAQLRGRYVAVRGGRVIDHDAAAAALVRRVGIKLGRRIFYVGFVGDEEPLIDLPGEDFH